MNFSKRQSYVLALAVTFLVLLLIAVAAPIRRELLLIVSSIIPALYVGFAIQAGSVRDFYIQAIGLIFFVALALIGYKELPILLPIGIGLHGFWDYLHHAKFISLKVHNWYPPFCAIIDWILAGAIIVFQLY